MTKASLLTRNSPPCYEQGPRVKGPRVERYNSSVKATDDAGRLPDWRLRRMTSKAAAERPQKPLH